MKGYSALIAEMLDHPKIKVLLNTDYASLENKESFERVFYSGPIDEYFGYELGELPYRSLRFDFVEYEREHFQSNSVINYPENHDFTRIGEYKYFLNDKSENTVVSFEYPEAFERGETTVIIRLSATRTRICTTVIWKRRKSSKTFIFWDGWVIISIMTWIRR